MKLKILLILLLFTQLCLAQETYYVLHVNGQVTAEGKALKPKDKVLSNAQLQFSSESAFVVVFSNSSGRKIIKPVKQADNTQSLVSYFVSENVFPVQNQLSTRGADALTSFADIKKYFSTPVLVIDTLTLTFDASALGINENNYLTLSSGEVEIKGKLEADKWKVPLSDLTPLDGQVLSLNFKDESFGSIMPICEVSLVLKTFTELKQEIDFYANLTKQPFDQIRLKDHIETVYGRFDTEYLEKLGK